MLRRDRDAREMAIDFPCFKNINYRKNIYEQQNIKKYIFINFLNKYHHHL